MPRPFPRRIVQAPPLPAVTVAAEIAAERVMDEIAALARSRPDRPLVLGLATGRTPVPLYANWVRRVRAGDAALRNVVTFNLDEYVGLTVGDARTCRAYMRRHLFEPIDLPEMATHFPDPGDCDGYERAIEAAGGIDLQLLGVGRNGHIGFNEPGSGRDSRTRVVELAECTRQDAAEAFGGVAAVPREGVTMGVGTILRARRIRLLAFGAGKRDIVRRIFQAPVGAEVPATWLRGHADVKVYLDAEAAGSRDPSR